jgi:hypothetical protein
MKTDIQCPACSSKRVSTPAKTIQVIFGLTMAVVGIGFLVPALTLAVGYYLFSLPLFAVGSISAYKAHSHPVVKGHCKDCNHQFEYLAEHAAQ